MTRLITLCGLGLVIGSGCGGKVAPTGHHTGSPQPPRAVVKRVPCKLRFGPLAAALEVDLGELRGLALDAKQLYYEIVSGDPGSTPPPAESPVVMVVNKKGNTFTYFALTPNVKELRVRTPNAAEVELIVKNQDPLRIELWVNTDQPIDLDVEFKDVPKP
jgi:hypothetical protein